MRHATSSLTRFIVAVTLVFAGSAQAFGQEHPFGLDPYKPSDAFWLRNFGGVLVAETPIVELAKLDPYKPSEAALIRQVGAAMPVCCPDWWGPGLAPHTTFVRRGLFTTEAQAPAPRTPGTAFVFVPPAPPAAPAAGSTLPAAPPTTTSAALPASNDGVWISFNGQRWVAAGRAVPLRDLQADRVGEYGGNPVYRARGTEDVIYVPSREGLVAPFRRK